MPAMIVGKAAAVLMNAAGVADARSSGSQKNSQGLFAGPPLWTTGTKRSQLLECENTATIDSTTGYSDPAPAATAATEPNYTDKKPPEPTLDTPQIPRPVTYRTTTRRY